LEESHPELMKNTTLLSFKDKNGQLEADVKLQLQLYFNQITGHEEIVKDENFINFANPLYKPILLTLGSSEKCGVLKMNSN
jgi:hypothetical protein